MRYYEALCIGLLCNTVPMSGYVSQDLSKTYPGFTKYCEQCTVKIGVAMIFAACDLSGFTQTCCIMSS